MRIKTEEEFSGLVFYLCLAIGIGLFTLIGWGIVEIMKEAL